jgi:hypothetical protein
MLVFSDVGIVSSPAYNHKVGISISISISIFQLSSPESYPTQSDAD